MKFYEFNDADWLCPECGAEMTSSARADFCPNCDYLEQYYPSSY